MSVKRKKGFTLIELVAVLVILAIIALIVTPLVLNIIRKARVAADKRSIDAYGRSIELAIAGYLLDTGKFPTSIDQLTIEYSGNEVVCETTQLNSDSSVYLTGCTVAGRSTGDYAYGTKEVITYAAYEVGDEVSYNNVNYRVIKATDETESTVTLLKAEPLTVEEVNTYGGVGTENNHVNMYATSNTSSSYYQMAKDINGYGGMAYYSSNSCYDHEDEENKWDLSGCKTSYEQSDVKYVVDAWKVDKAPAATEARLITYAELTDLGEIIYNETPSGVIEDIQLKYDWAYNGNYCYWSMTPYQDSALDVWMVYSNGSPGFYDVLDYHSFGNVVRPVITISKSLIST